MDEIFFWPYIAVVLLFTSSNEVGRWGRKKQNTSGFRDEQLPWHLASLSRLLMQIIGCFCEPDTSKRRGYIPERIVKCTCIDTASCLLNGNLSIIPLFFFSNQPSMLKNSGLPSSLHLQLLLCPKNIGVWDLRGHIKNIYLAGAISVIWKVCRDLVNDSTHWKKN